MRDDAAAASVSPERKLIGTVQSAGGDWTHAGDFDHSPRPPGRDHPDQPDGPLTTSAGCIWTELARVYVPLLVLLEHTRRQAFPQEEHLDLARIGRDGQPRRGISAGPSRPTDARTRSHRPSGG